MKCCSNCGFPLDSKENFCRNCGMVIVSDTKSQLQKDNIEKPSICSNCGFNLKQTDTYCMRCGKSNYVSPTSNFVKTTNDRVCSNCGLAINSNIAFCSNCGSSVSKKPKNVKAIISIIVTIVSLIVCVLLYIPNYSANFNLNNKYEIYIPKDWTEENNIYMSVNNECSVTGLYGTGDIGKVRDKYISEFGAYFNLKKINGITWNYGTGKEENYTYYLYVKDEGKYIYSFVIVEKDNSDVCKKYIKKFEKSLNYVEK